MLIYDSSDFPLIVEGFLSKKDCDTIIEFTENNISLFDANGNDDYKFWSKRVIDYDKIGSIEHPITKLMISSNKNVSKSISNFINNSIVYPDTLQIVRWFRGYELYPHADKENPDGTPHPYPWREFASVIYLNDNYEGGEIYFPNKNIQLKPKPGTLVVFPGTVEFLHGVKEVPNGIRYTIASFFTSDKTKNILL